jgi:hypothetical protein
LRTVSATVFPDYAAKTKNEISLPMEALAERIRTTTAPRKEDLPWLKFALFGPISSPTNSGSLRWNGNVKKLSGIIGDYDGEEMPIEEAAERLDKAGIIAIVYTSPSHMREGHKHRWRVCCPFSVLCEPDRHYLMVARVNGVLNGVLAPESFTLSQAYYFGSVSNNPAHQVLVIDGTSTIDLCNELDQIAIGKPNSNGIGQAGDPEAPIEDIRAALSIIPNPMPWWKPGPSWVEWNNLGMAVWRASGGSVEGFDAFDKWSRQSPKYDGDETEFRWRHYFDSPPSQIGFGSLVHWAREIKPNWRPPSKRPEPEPRPVLTEPSWPNKLGDPAYHGIAGDFVRLIEPESESDPAALLFQFLTASGNLMSERAYVQVEAAKHYPNVFSTIIGDTSKARKGTSQGWVERVLEPVDPLWAKTRLCGGLSTGEGLIEWVRDPRYERQYDKASKSYIEEVVDEGVSDKRLLVVEQELARVLRVMQRRDNTLSSVMRQAWDGHSLRVMTKKNASSATNPRISIVAHITTEEFQAELTELNAANGFGNRFVYAAARRSKALPFGGNIPDDAIQDLAKQLRASVNRAPFGQIPFDDIASAHWIDIYEELSEGRPGIYGAMTSRSEAQAVRLALIYALLDGQVKIGIDHLRAALEVVRYSNDTVRFIFKDATGNRIADTILRALRANPDGMTRSAISSDLFARNTPADQIGEALSLLLRHGMIRSKRTETSGRPSEIWIPT